MEEKISIAGFGGQGVVLAGNIIAYAALDEGKKILGMVSYGAEMRGGASSSSVIISDEEIDSPIIEESDITIILSQEAYDKFMAKAKKNGVVLINSSEVKKRDDRKDVKVVDVPATEIAKNLGNIKVANMVMIGALIEKTKVLKEESIIKALEKPFSGRKKEFIYINENAFRKGIKAAVEADK